MLSLRRVTRSFTGRRVLGPVDLDLDSGAVCLAVGPNGAGKTTLLRIASGLLNASGGTVDRAGSAVYLRPGAGARDRQTVAAAVSWAARIADRPDGAECRRGRVTEALNIVDMTALGGARVGGLSTGQRARLSVAVALAVQPALACLDEPAAHLDLDGVARVRAALAALVEAGTALLVATHDPDQLAGLADGHVRLVAGTPAKIAQGLP